MTSQRRAPSLDAIRARGRPPSRQYDWARAAALLEFGGDLRVWSHLADGTSIAGELVVGGEQDDAFYGCLREEQPIKRVFVQRGEGIDTDGMFARDRQLDVSVVEERAPEHVRFDPEVLAAERLAAEKSNSLSSSFSRRFARGERRSG